jgi:predicted DNA-binding transcriptional regulator YafY
MGRDLPMVYSFFGEKQHEARMAKFERVQELDQLLRGSREPLSLEELCSRLEASPATVKRSIRFLREQLNAPIGYDHFQKGYLYERNTPQAAAPQPLPGLWFNGQELAALLTADESIKRLGELDGA